jgi:ABC-type proline/glycine betaine transport system ATPase subunit
LGEHGLALVIEQHVTLAVLERGQCLAGTLVLDRHVLEQGLEVRLRLGRGPALLEQGAIGGEDVPARRRGIGFVFQHYAAFKHMTVRENVGFALSIRRRPKEEIRRRVDELLAIVQLEGLGQRDPSQLSGGQRQRMALARALAVDPAVLLLDEPFGALDARVRSELRRWLRRLHEQTEVTTVLVTHDQEEAMEVADRIAVMDHARIRQVGAPRELYEDPSNPFVMEFFGTVNRVGNAFVRPHDLKLHRSPNGTTQTATIERLVHLGFLGLLYAPISCRTTGRPSRRSSPPTRSSTPASRSVTECSSRPAGSGSSSEARAFSPAHAAVAAAGLRSGAASSPVERLVIRRLGALLPVAPGATMKMWTPVGG